ncbi:hypothetical protein LJB89_04155, partial [Tyzzerella sp. OttesenSCG-928-J15]|nr:hypothetical protein [Tyzzerella sp. OttesenSCG-928-J15]
MSKVFKSSRVTVDEERRVKIDVAPVLPEVKNVFPLPDIEGFDEMEDSDEAEDIRPEDIIENAKKEAEAIIGAATIEAEQIIANIRQLAAAEREEAAEQGYDEGYTEGHAKGHADADGMRNEAQKVVDQAYVIKDQIMAQAEPEIVELIAKLIKKLLYNEVEINPQVISLLVKSGLAHMTLNGDVNIRVSQDDYDNLIEQKADVLASVEGLANISFSQDLALAKAACIIDTDFGSVDCGLDSQYR